MAALGAVTIILVSVNLLSLISNTEGSPSSDTLILNSCEGVIFSGIFHQYCCQLAA